MIYCHPDLVGEKIATEIETLKPWSNWHYDSRPELYQKIANPMLRRCVAELRKGLTGLCNLNAEKHHWDSSASLSWSKPGYWCMHVLLRCPRYESLRTAPVAYWKWNLIRSVSLQLRKDIPQILMQHARSDIEVYTHDWHRALSEKPQGGKFLMSRHWHNKISPYCLLMASLGDGSLANNTNLNVIWQT